MATPPYRPHYLGRIGELEAVRYLCSLGYEICAQNWRGSIGEIDIIATQTQLHNVREFIFVEVKTRSSRTFGDPFEAITSEKYRRLYRLAREWIALHQPRSPWRIDVILLLKNSHGFELVHHKGLIA